MTEDQLPCLNIDEKVSEVPGAVVRNYIYRTWLIAACTYVSTIVQSFIIFDCDGTFPYRTLAMKNTVHC
jgi:hypothetical protein